jgi:hypothetical protein
VNQADWPEIKKLLADALEREPRSRRAFVESLPGVRPAVVAAVRSMLDTHDRSADDLDPDRLAPIRAIAGEDDALVEAGEVVGRYRVIGPIGRGGMGSVYEAEDTELARHVAIKVHSPGRWSTSAVRRFQLETRVLARLRHPGIAQIYESGTHRLSNGASVPYFAMELVVGAMPITRYAAGRALPVSDRLRLLARVCDAVHHGHLRGIIHRDLKPGNILVDSSGDPKLIDFGVARPTDPDATITANTREGDLVGTLKYMSPEQVAGDGQDIDVRSDVYTLGVILYELLAGKLPYEVDDSVPIRGARTIIETQPARLSETDAGLRGDVETIVHKALSKEPRDRYQSAAALGSDLLRYLAGEPIEARPPSIVTQLRSLARRHRAATAGFTAAAAALTIGFVMTAGALVQAKSAQAAAQRLADRSQRTADFLRNAFAARGQDSGPSPWVLAHPEHFPELMAFEGAPAPWDRRGTEGSLGMRMYSYAATNLERLFPDEPDLRADLAESIHMSVDGTSESLRPEFTDLLRKIYDWRLGGLGPDDPKTIRSAFSLASRLSSVGDTPGAAKVIGDAIEPIARIYGPDHSMMVAARLTQIEMLAAKPETEAKAREIAAALHNGLRASHGPDFFLTLQAEAALSSLNPDPATAVTQLRDVLARTDANVGPNTRPAITVARLLATAMRRPLSNTSPSELVDVHQSILDRDDGMRQGKSYIDSDYAWMLARSLLSDRRPAEAAALARRVISNFELSISDERARAASSRWHAMVARCLLWERRNFEEAKAHAREAWESSEAMHVLATNGANDELAHGWVAYFHALYAGATAFAGEPVRAEEMLRERIAMRGGVIRTGYSVAAQQLMLAEALRLQDRVSEARAELAKGKAALGDDSTNPLMLSIDDLDKELRGRGD